jgi:activator of HSP90 ATPase
MTRGREAICSDREGDKFSTWDGYITGTNVRLNKDKLIGQNWRTTEFANSEKDSELIIILNETTKGCELVLNHSNIPKLQPDYEHGWSDHYFTPMKEYFRSK